MCKDRCIRCPRPVNGTSLLCSECADQIRRGTQDTTVVKTLQELVDLQRPDRSDLCHSDTAPQALHDYIKRNVLPGSRVLEVGAGGGYTGSALLEAGYTNVICSEVTTTGVKVIRERGVETLACDVAFLPFAAESIDLVISIEVLEHLKNPMLHIAEAARVLRPGGLFAVKTPNRIIATIYYKIVRQLDIDIWHPSMVSPRQLTRLLGEEGFAAQHLTVSPAGSIIRKIPSFLGLRWMAANIVPWSLTPSELRPSIVCVARKT